MDLQCVTPNPDRPGPASPPAKSFEFLDSFSPAYGIERAAMVTQQPAIAPPIGHTC
jgi:hypothetical protein